MSNPSTILAAAAICAIFALEIHAALGLPPDMEEMRKKLSERKNQGQSNIAITQKFGGKVCYGSMTLVESLDYDPPGIEVHVSIHSDSARSHLIHKVKLDLEKDSKQEMTGREITDPTQKTRFLANFPSDTKASESYKAMVKAFIDKCLEWIKG